MALPDRPYVSSARIIDNPIVDPWSVEGLEKKKPKKPGRARKWLLRASLGLVAASALGGAAFGVYRATTDGDVDAADTSSALAIDEVERHGATPPKAPKPPPPQAPQEPQNPQGSVPHDSHESKVGALTLVEIGTAEQSLEDALEAQQKKAKAAQKQILLVTVRDGCTPCVETLKTLEDTRMQDALDSVVLVKVNADIFDKELHKLGVPTDKAPGFFLFDDRIHVKDKISGGEWDDNIAENIAPVLGQFVRGTYTTRREKAWIAPKGTGTFM